MKRLDEIRTDSDINDWQFISGPQNPADDCSRYACPSVLMSERHRWFNAPGFLFERRELVSKPRVTKDNESFEFSKFQVKLTAWILKLKNNWKRTRNNTQSNDKNPNLARATSKKLRM